MVEFTITISRTYTGKIHIEAGPYDVAETIDGHMLWDIGGIEVNMDQLPVTSLLPLYKASCEGNDCVMTANMWVDNNGKCSLSNTTIS